MRIKNHTFIVPECSEIDVFVFVCTQNEVPKEFCSFQNWHEVIELDRYCSFKDYFPFSLRNFCSTRRI